MSELIETQKRYYAARAAEYDDWWFRRGRHSLPPAEKAAWDSDVHEVEASLEGLSTRPLDPDHARSCDADVAPRTVADGREFAIVKPAFRTTANGHFLYGGTR